MTVHNVLNSSFVNRDMTVAINLLPNTYGRLNELGLFSGSSLTSTFAEIKHRDGVISILDAKDRGAPAGKANRENEKSLILKVPHYPGLKDDIGPQDIQNMNAFVDNVYRPKTAAEALAERLAEVRLPHDITAEWYRMQAIKGIIEDARGNELYNLYTHFSVTKKTFNMALDTNTTKVVNICRDIKAYVSKNLRGMIATGPVHVLVSSDFFQALITHPEVEKYYINWSNAQQLANPNHQAGNAGNGEQFVFGDIIWEVYDAEAPNAAGETKKFIADGGGHGFPTGTNKMFLQFDAPPDRMDEANRPIQPGAEIYISVEPKKHNKGFEIDSESNRLFVNSRVDLSFDVQA